MRVQLLAGAALCWAAVSTTHPSTAHARVDCFEDDCSLRIVSPASGEIFNHGLPKVMGYAEPGAVVEVLANYERSKVSADESGRWLWWPAESLREGDQRVTVRVGDESVGVVIKIDSVPPVVTIQSPLPNSVRTAVNLIARGQVEPGATLELTLDGEPIDVTVAPDGTWLHLGARALEDGPYVLIATARDSAGNVASEKLGFRVDRLAPHVQITSPRAGFHNSAPRALVGVAEPGATLSISAPSLETQVVVPSSGRWNVTLPQLAEGHHQVRVVATDSVGWSAEDRIELVVDTTPPALAVSTDLDRPVSEPIVRFRGTAEPGVRVTIESHEGVIGYDQVPATGRWEVITYEPLTDGLHGLVFTATDRAGNSTWMMTSVLIDTIAPTLELSELLESDDGRVWLSGYAEPRAHIDVNLDGAPVVKTWADATGRWSADLAVPPVGSFEIEVLAMDAAGNTSEARHRLTRTIDEPIAPAAGCSGGDSGLPLGLTLLALVALGLAQSTRGRRAAL